MNTEKMGLFISELRKSQDMTQKDLAAKLNISDKAVSKWERGKSCPDISLLSPLSEILGVSVNELLSSERSDSKNTSVEETIANVTQYADKAVEGKAKAIQNFFAMSFSILILVGIITCAICDLAISGSFTWSLIPICAGVFSWLVLIPSIKYGVKGVIFSLIALSVFIVPFLLVINILIESNNLLLPIGIRMSAVGVLYLWCVFILSIKLKKRKFIASAISVILAIPTTLAVNFLLAELLSEPQFDVWDAMSIEILLAIAVTLLFIDSSARKKSLSNTTK